MKKIDKLAGLTHKVNSNSKLCFKFNKSEFSLINKDEIIVKEFNLDKDRKNHNIQRCDYILMIDSLKKIFYIELKGKDRDKGIIQIINTLEKIYYNSEFTNYGFVICSRVPNETPQTQLHKLRLQRDYNLILTIKSRLHEVEIKK